MVKRVAMVIVVALAGVAAASAQTSTGSGQTTVQQQPSGATGPSGTTGPQRPAAAQTPQPGSQQTSQTTMMGDDDVETRPATTTINGDTGLWFVPTAEILPARKWSLSAYRVNFDYDQGFTDVSNWPVTFGFGLADRAELFGAWTLVRRIDRDVRPLFTAGQPEAGGIVNDYPFVRQGWSGNQLGDLLLGAKVNLFSQHRQSPVAFALRGMIKLPTAKDDDEGVGSGKADFMFDAILSSEVNERVEFSGFAGFISRGNPDGVAISNGFRWGIGAGMPSRRSLRLTAELHGEAYSDDGVVVTTPIIAQDGTMAPGSSNIRSPLNASLGLTWQGQNGIFAGAGINWNLGMNSRSDYFSGFEDRTGDAAGFQFRIGYHPGVRVYVPPPPPAPPPPPPTPAPQHDLSVRAACDPCTVDVGKASTVTATALDSIGCSVTYNWSAPTGTFANRTARQTAWTAPMQEGTVPVTVTVTCPQDGKTATDTVNIQVIRPAVREFTFEDVHFDFDRYSLRPEATRALDEAISTLQANAQLRLEIEGHTCNIGTAEYNLALGERRANAVRDYLSSRGIGADRLRTVSYGEERPKHDNAREETRRLNRRAAMLVRITQ
jgi:outer membrane protein OmpA-like peptidoglycan-associated protein